MGNPRKILLSLWGIQMYERIFAVKSFLRKILPQVVLIIMNVMSLIKNFGD